MDNFEATKNQFINNYIQAQEDLKNINIEIFTDMFDDIDGSKGMERNRALMNELRDLKREDFSSDEAFAAKQHEINMKGLTSPFKARKEEIENRIDTLRKDGRALIEVEQNNIKIQKLQADNNSKGY